MKIAATFVLLAALLSVVACAAPPQWPSQYTVDFVMSLPYGNITEPVAVAFDSDNQRQWISYYENLDVYLYLGNQKQSYYIGPQIDKKVCSSMGAEGLGMTTVLPDLTNFTDVGNDVVLGRKVRHFQDVIQMGGRTNTYDFFCSEDGTPIMYRFLGFDAMFGSHYDEYVMVYDNYHPSVDDKQFIVDVSCENATEDHDMEYPLAQFAAMMPQREGSENTFERFSSRFDKKYSSVNERAQRKEIFSNNMKKVMEHNADKTKTHTVKLNHMSDMSDEEFKNLILPTIKGDKRTASQLRWATHQKDILNVESLPESVDWRPLGYVSEIKDQGICGSCWSFAAAEAIEGQNYATNGNHMVRLSEQNLVDCSWEYTNAGCGGGFAHEAFEYVAAAGGIAQEDVYPYLMQNGYCTFDKRAVGAKISGYNSVPSGNVTALMSAIAAKGPIAVAIDASHFSFRFYSEGTYYEPACGNGLNDLDHAVLAVGYGTDSDGNDYWIVKNSWSTHWGHDGYVHMSRKDNNCGVATQATYPLM